VELKDEDILEDIVKMEHVKCVVMDANVVVYALVDASVLLALAAQENDSAALINAVVVVVDADVRGSHSCVIVVS